jgi:hypothetical protein
MPIRKVCNVSCVLHTGMPTGCATIYETMFWHSSGMPRAVC